MSSPLARPPVAEYGTQESWALEQDRDDVLAPYREEFELPPGENGQPLVYFCGNSLGLLPRRARAELQEEMDAWARFGVEAHFQGRHPWYRYSESLAEPLARIVGAQPDEVVAMNSLTINLHLMLVSFYRPDGKRRKILMEEGAFPSDYYAVTSQLAARGFEATDLLIARPRSDETVLRTEDLERLLIERGNEIALVWLGAVHYATGQLLDLERIAGAARRAGCRVGFDLAHAAGNVVLGLHDWDVDFAVWCSYKYLNGGPGAVGGCFVHRRHGREQGPRFAGWWGNDSATRFEMLSQPEFVPVSGAAGWQVSNPPILALAPLRASLSLFDRAGMKALRVKSERLTGYLEFLVERLGHQRLTLLTPREPAARGCQLSWQVRGQGADLGARVVARLRERGMVTDHRQPDVLRVAPVPLYNSFHEVWRFAQALEELLDAG